MAAGIDGLRRHLQLPSPIGINLYSLKMKLDLYLFVWSFHVYVMKFASYQDLFTAFFCIYFDETSDTNPADVAATLKRLPESLSEAVEALENDKVLHELIGQKLLVAIKGVRKVQYYCLLRSNRYQQWYISTNLLFFKMSLNSLRSSIIRRIRMHISNSFTDTNEPCEWSLSNNLLAEFQVEIYGQIDPWDWFISLKQKHFVTGWKFPTRIHLVDLISGKQN